MQYTRRDNEALFIQTGKVSFRESLIHNKDLSILRLDCFTDQIMKSLNANRTGTIVREAD